MKILFIGSIPGHQPGTGQIPGPEHQELFDAAEQLGYSAAKRGHTILLGSQSKNTVDSYVLNGVVRYGNESPSARLSVEIHRPRDAKRTHSHLPGNIEVTRHTYHADESGPYKWIVSHVRALDTCDALIALGGGTSTRLVGSIAADRAKPVIAIASFGGSSQDLFERVQYAYKEKLGNASSLMWLTEPWGEESAGGIVVLAETLHSLSSGFRPHLYFLSYSWADSPVADHVETLLRRNNRNVLRDEAYVETGCSLSRTVEAMIGQTDTFLTLWSEAYSKSTWCPHELEYARNRQAKGERPRRIVLLTLDPTEVPLRFTDTLRQLGDERHRRELALLKIVREEHSHGG